MSIRRNENDTLKKLPKSKIFRVTVMNYELLGSNFTFSNWLIIF